MNCLFFLSYLFKRLPGDLSMAWWRFMGSTVVVMVTILSPFSPSASSRLLCVRASPVSCTQTSNFLFFPNLNTRESTFRVIRHLYRNQDSTCSLGVITAGQCWLENDALKLKQIIDKNLKSRFLECVLYKCGFLFAYSSYSQSI